MKKLIIISLLFLTSCAQWQEKQRLAQLEKRTQQCAGYGFKAETEGMAQCLMLLEQSELSRQQAAASALLGYSAQMQQINQMQQPQAVRMNCTTSRTGALGNINCF